MESGHNLLMNKEILSAAEIRKHHNYWGLAPLYCPMCPYGIEAERDGRDTEERVG